MPRNLNDYAYISVPVRKGSYLHTHLKEEALRAGGSTSGQIGPYVASLLEDRDRHLYGEEGSQGSWFSSHPASLAELIEKAVQKAIVSALPSLFASFPLMAASTQPQPTSMAPSPEEAIEREAAAMAVSLTNGGWGCDDE